jgi:hypothetical protein
MGPLDIGGTPRLVLGLLTGVLFGFILQREGLTGYATNVGFFRLTDLRMLKVMMILRPGDTLPPESLQRDRAEPGTPNLRA